MIRNRATSTCMEKLSRTTVPPVGITGSTYFDCDQNRLFISNGGRWIPLLHHEESTDSNESDAGSRAISSSYQASLIQAFKTLILPAVIISSQPLGAVGSLAFDTTTQKLFYSNGTAWIELLIPSFPITISSTGSGVSIVNNGVSPSFTLKSLVGSTSITITPGVNEVDIAGSYIAGANVTIIGNVISAIGAGPSPVASLTAGDSTIVIGGTVSNPTVGGNYVAGNNISIVGNVISTSSTVLVSSIAAEDTTILITGTSTNPIISGNYTGGTNVTITGNSIAASIPITGVNSISSGNATIVIGGTSSNPTVAGGYVAGADITIVGNVISSTGTAAVASVTAGDSTIVVDNTDPTQPVIFGNYTNGTNVTITGNVISATSGTGVNAVIAGNDTVVIGGTFADPTVALNYTSTIGSGISVTGNTIAVDIISSFNGGTTGFLPNTATTGVVTLDGVLNVQHGGTGQTTYTDGQLLIGNSTGNTLSKSTLTAGSGIGIVNGSGTVILSNTGVTSIIAGTGVMLSGNTGNVTISIDTSNAVGSFSGGTTGLTPSAPTSGSIVLGGVLNIPSGGTGNGGTYSNGQILIGNGSTLTKTTITAGAGISITNGTGTITISKGTSVVTSFSGGTTGLTTPSSTGNLVLSGTLNIQNGGTGNTTYSNGQLLIGNSTGNTLTKNTLTAGSGISIVNGAGTITVINTAPASGQIYTIGQYLTSIPIGVDNIGPNISMKGITPGPGMQLSESPPNLLVTGASQWFRAILTANTAQIDPDTVITGTWSVTGNGVTFTGGQYTFPLAGVYFISFQTGCATQDSFTICKINGVTNIMVSNAQASSSGNLSNGSIFFRVNAGDKVGLYNGSQQQKVYKWDFNGNAPVTWFSAGYITP